MTNPDAREWIVSWFTRHTSSERDAIELDAALSYFDKEWLDSLSFITFIADIESHFDIRFSVDEFQNRDFATIDGLARIVNKRTHERA